ncbi:MAG: DUF362 domain-containing protein [Candidatus Thermoplasmatota archaeon]
MNVYISKVQNGNTYKAVEICFNEIATDNFLKDVRKVLIKPNFVNASPADTGVTTDPRIIKALIKILKEKGIEEVIVGESSLSNTKEVFKSLNLYELEKFGAKVVNFDDDEWIRVDSPLQLALKKFRVAKKVFDCDLFISVAKMKTHSDTHVTLSIKNVLGTIPKIDRKACHIIDINKAIVDVFAYIIKNKKFLSFIDGIYALEGKLGPTTGKPVKMDLVIASSDAVAADATCVEIMDYDINKVEHILLSNKFGFGKIEDREIIGEKIENIKRKFEMPVFLPKQKLPILSLIMEKTFKRKPYLKNREKCIGCKCCLEACPKDAIFMKNGIIKIRYKNCISCLVCCEACIEGALDYELSNLLLYKFGEKLMKIYRKLF